MPHEKLSPGEIEVLIDGSSDDVAFDWLLIHLGVSIEAAFIGVDPQGKPVAVLKPPLWQIAMALVGACDEATIGPAQEHDDVSLDVIALAPKCVQAITDSLDSEAKTDMLYETLMSDKDIQTQTSSYVAEERAVFETEVQAIHRASESLVRHRTR